MATYSSTQMGRGPGQRRGESRRPGQWKLAYADFLTALMAFFLLMWLATGASQAERAAIADYFTGRETGAAAGPPTPQLISTHSVLTHLAQDLQIAVGKTGSAERVLLSQEVDHLRIDLTDLHPAALFALGDVHFNPEGRKLIDQIGEALSPHDITIEIEGHTDAYALSGHGNWPLSLGRAEAARIALTEKWLDADQVKGISGYADTRPLLADQPHAPVNRRVSLLVRPVD